METNVIAGSIAFALAGIVLIAFAPAIVRINRNALGLPLEPSEESAVTRQRYAGVVAVAVAVAFFIAWLRR